ncbi:MAG: glycosyltransferase family 2 protein [Acholeplasmatales bacterium]|nr:glycosyltransferase family 2 protein [Acholeplasmatales bacterium]
MSFLNIIIPHHNEDDEMVERMLRSIAIQDGIDFNEDIKLIIIDDNSKTKISPELLKKYNLINIEYYENETNLGPGLSRQKGLELSDSQYVMFMDSDDELFNGAALHIIVSCLKDTGVDLLRTDIVIEFLDKNGNMQYGLCGFDNYVDSLHGKVFKKEYIDKHGIHFSPKLKKLYEDSFFVKTFINVDFDNLKTIALKYPTYKWNYNANSITKKKSKHDKNIDNFSDFFNNGLLQYEFLSKKNSPNANRILIGCMFGVSIMLESNFFDGDDLEDKKKKFEDKLFNLYKKYEDVYNSFDKEELSELYQATLESIKYNNSSLEVKKSFYDFIGMMENREVN